MLMYLFLSGILASKIQLLCTEFDALTECAEGRYSKALKRFSESKIIPVRLETTKPLLFGLFILTTVLGLLIVNDA